ncbi:hypothetical protein [Pseudooceanicola sp. HF7]|uniref:hypothetical protein n=1 Tax=Pseudooceanicola sp. HF7 TaxID=2721560 RepID=UPI00142FF61C|nr:hypothetical protein [Pseudooceanicola sp. HF7]NIZ10590.1 hypothetical protein [Pseudooceanicola sp. HF7]
MAVEFQAPEIPTPHRVIFLGASTDGWFTASGEERREKVLPRMKKMFADWADMGAKTLATLDDDLFMVGQPSTPDFTWYLIFEVPDQKTIAAMIQCVRQDIDGVRLDRYMRLEARVGRPFFLLES